MTQLGYHASHEQFKPSDLLKWSVYAKEAGFRFINSSDHFHPWSERQGQSGFSFAWLGASLHATGLPHGVVCAPGQRYHPAIVAQAAATLNEMYPEKFWVSAGSGEALNERITGGKWPAKQERNARLEESVSVMRRLFAGETVTHHGLVDVEEAKLYTLPDKAPVIMGAAVTAETAGWVAGWADGMVTVSRPLEELKQVVHAFRNNGGRDKPMHLKVQLSVAPTDEEALQGAYDQWRTNIFAGSVLGDLWRVEHFDALGELVQPEQMRKHVCISADPAQHVKWIREFTALGFEKVILHNVNRDQGYFIRTFGRDVLPVFHGRE